MNLVLIGMPGSGKSTVGRLLARRTGRLFLETDAYIAAQEGMTIPTLFSARGEGYFRRAEEGAISHAARQKNAVISTGGGAVLRPENMAALQSTGVIFFLDRPPQTLAQGDLTGRPLLANGAEEVFKLYTERITLYRKYAQYTISDPESPEDAAEKVLQIVEREGIR